MFVFILSILFGFTVFFFANALHIWRTDMKAKKELMGVPVRSFDSLILRFFMPAVEMVSPFFLHVRVAPYRKYIDGRLLRAGLKENLRFEEFLAYQFLMGAAFAALSLMLRSGNVFVLACSACAGSAFPLLWLRSLISKRGGEITYELPMILDLLTLSVEAGLDFISAADRIAKRGGGTVLVRELGHMLGLIRFGKSRGDALAEFRDRLAHPAASSFVAMLLQADRLGASIGPVLRAHAVSLRAERFQRAERTGVIASQKLLVPLVFCIMPAVFVIVFGPIFVMWRSGYFERLFQ